MREDVERGETKHGLDHRETIIATGVLVALMTRQKWWKGDYWGTTLPPFPSLRGALRRLRGFHQNPLGPGVLDPVHQLAALVHVADRLGHGNAGLDEHHDAHR